MKKVIKCLMLVIIAIFIFFIGEKIYYQIKIDNDYVLYNDKGNINRQILENQLYETFGDKFKIIRTQYRSVDEVNENRGTLAESEVPYYSFLAYNEEDNICLSKWAWGNPQDKLENYINQSVSDINEYNIAKKIIVKLEDDLDNARYYYAFSEINDRGYDKYTGEYHWRITMIDKADLSHKYYLEGYFDSNTNQLEIIFNEEKINQIGKIILITFFVIITYILINSIVYMRKKRNKKEQENIENHEKYSKYGIVSLILLIISIILLCMFFLGTAIMFSILSIIFGIIALVKKEKKHCTIIAILSIILSSIVIIIDLWNLISIFIPIGNIFL